MNNRQAAFIAAASTTGQGGMTWWTKRRYIAERADDFLKILDGLDNDAAASFEQVVEKKK